MDLFLALTTRQTSLNRRCEAAGVQVPGAEEARAEWGGVGGRDAAVAVEVEVGGVAGGSSRFQERQSERSGIRRVDACLHAVGVVVESIGGVGDDLPAAKDGGKSLLGWVGRVQGLAIDAHGNFNLAGAEAHTSGAAITVITPDGKSVRAMILNVPGNISSLALGGPKGTTLYIAGSGSSLL